MKRRFLQFSLRGLLGLAALVGLLLGARHLLEAYGSYLEVGHAAIGKPVRVAGSFVRVLGPPTCHISITAYVDVRGYNHCACSIGALAERSWLCCYAFDHETVPLEKSGAWTVDAHLYPLDDPRDEESIPLVAKSKTFTLSEEAAE